MERLNDSHLEELSIAADVANQVKEPDYFVVTGSHSISLLTGEQVNHNDLDANIFTQDVKRSVESVGLSIEEHLPNLNLTSYKNNRLEYSYKTKSKERQVELQFIKYDDLIRELDHIHFILNNETKRVIPTEQRNIKRNDTEYEFRIKTLPYAIATWALRITGVALNQKRNVRQSDIDHLRHLVNTKHSQEAVARAILSHPQAPTDVDPNTVMRMMNNFLERQDG